MNESSTWTALRNPVFRRLWIATVISGTCVAAHDSAATWMMNIFRRVSIFHFAHGREKRSGRPQNATKGRHKPFSAAKIWFDEFLQNAAFPAVVLAFACSSLNNEIADVRTGRPTDHRRAAKMHIWYLAPIHSGSSRRKVLSSNRIV